MTTTEHHPAAPASALRTVVLTVFVVLAGVGGLFAATNGFHAFTAETARRVAVQSHPVPVPAVPLEDQSGARFTLADLKGEWLVVDFIYTRCTTLCMVLGGDFADLRQQLAGPVAAGKVRFVSISFDPKRDDPVQLTSYLLRFRNAGPGWIAARPVTEDGLHRLTNVFGVTVIPDGMGGYTHNAAMLLVDPEGRLVDIYDTGKVEQVKAAILSRIGS